MVRGPVALRGCEVNVCIAPLRAGRSLWVVGGFEVDTAGLAARGSLLNALDGSLGEARATFSAVQSAVGAAGVSDVDGGIEDLVQRWGVAVTALQQAAVGLGLGASRAAIAYDETDRTVIGP